MKTDAVVGWYSAAYSIINGFGLISSSILIASFPLFSRLYNENKKDTFKNIFLKVMQALIIIASIIIILAMFFGNQIIKFLYGSQYINSFLIFIILCWANLFIFLNNLTGITINSINKQKVNVLIVGCGAIINIFLNFLLIPRYEGVGAAITTVFTELVVFLIGFGFIVKQTHFLDTEKIK